MLLQIHEPGETPVPHEADHSLAVGIDLGTTNSVVAIARDGKPEVLRDESGQALVPSMVGPEGLQILVSGGWGSASSQSIWIDSVHGELITKKIDWSWA